MALVQIGLDIEEIAFIPVMRVLKGLPGVAKVHFDLDLLGNKRGGQRKPANGHDAAPSDVKAGVGRKGLKNILFEALISGPKTHSEMKELASANDYKEASTSQALNDLRKGGIAEHDRLGNWSLTKEALAKLRATEGEATERRALPAPEKKSRNSIPGITVAMVVLAAVRSGVTRRQDLRPHLIAKGYAPEVNGPCAKAVASGWVKSKDGALSLTPSGKSKKLPPEAFPSTAQE